MKNLLFFICSLTFSVGSAVAQNNIDSLLSKLQNHQLLLACSGTQGTLDTYSLEALAIIKEGKVATRSLIPLLTDPEKGIIVHYILVRIWREKEFAPVKLRFEPDKTAIFNFHGLTLRHPNNGSFTANQSDLELNKQVWLKRIPRRFQ